MRRLLAMLSLSLLPVASASAFTLGPGQTVKVNEAKITLVSWEDTRCPPRAYCLMQGYVKAKLLLVKGTSTRLYSVFLPGVAVQTLAGTLRLKFATDRSHQGPVRLIFVLS